jgi:hypothetical protein
VAHPGDGHDDGIFVMVMAPIFDDRMSEMTLINDALYARTWTIFMAQLMTGGMAGCDDA